MAVELFGIYFPFAISEFKEIMQALGLKRNAPSEFSYT